MKIKLDENLPTELRDELLRLEHDVDTVEDEGLRGHSHQQIWDAANKDGRFVITQDMDFSDTRKFAPGTHNGILLVRLRNPSRRQLIETLSRTFHQFDLDSWKGAFVVLSESKIRVKHADG